MEKSNSGSPIFLLGCPRSGTSLLSRMLNSHPRIAVPFEAHIYNRFWRFRHSYGALATTEEQTKLLSDILSMRLFECWDQPPTFDAAVKNMSRPGFHGVYEAMMNAWSQQFDKARWGEKTPQNIWYWRQINKGFPDAKFVHIVRDGRDCARSLMRVRFGPKLLLPAAELWAAYIDIMREMETELGPDRVHRLRYEKLVTDPQSELRVLCAFLGEQYDPAMLSYHKHLGNYHTDPHNRENLLKPVLVSNKQKWKTAMPEQDQRVFEAVAGRQLKALGFPVRHPGAAVGRVGRWWCKRVKHPPLRLLAMLRNVEGWRDSVSYNMLKLKLSVRQRIDAWG